VATDLCRSLLKAGAPVRHTLPREILPLNLALKRGDGEIAHWLLNAGADPARQDPCGNALNAARADHAAVQALVCQLGGK
jgi:ankyrin repeat protein